MANDREEQNPKHTRGRSGVGSRKKNQKISEGEVPKQKGQKRGRPCLYISKQQRKEKHNTDCRTYREKKKAEFERLQDFENEFLEEFGSWSLKSLKAEFQRLLDFEKEFQAEFGSSSLKILKEILCELGVTEKVLKAIRKEASWEELGKVCQTSEDEIPAQKKILQDKMEEDLSDGVECGLRYYGPSPALAGREVAMNEPIKQDADKEKGAFHSKEYLEVAEFLSEDERIEEPSDVVEGNEKLTKTIREFREALIGSQSTTPGGEEVVMNEAINQDDMTWQYEVEDLGNKDETLSNAQSPSEVEDAAMCQPINTDKVPPIDDNFSPPTEGDLLSLSFGKEGDLLSDTTHFNFWRGTFTEGDLQDINNAKNQILEPFGAHARSDGD